MARRRCYSATSSSSRIAMNIIVVSRMHRHRRIVTIIIIIFAPACIVRGLVTAFTTVTLGNLSNSSRVYLATRKVGCKFSGVFA